MDNLTAGTAGSRAKEPEGSPAPAQVSDIRRNRCPTRAEMRSDLVGRSSIRTTGVIPRLCPSP